MQVSRLAGNHGPLARYDALKKGTASLKALQRKRFSMEMLTRQPEVRFRPPGNPCRHAYPPR
jgi:hypothetical protein